MKLKDVKPYFNMDGFILTGKKEQDKDWRNPTLGFGFFNYRARFAVMRNKIEPYGSKGWRENAINFQLDTNGMGMFVEGVLMIIEKGEDDAISVQVEEQKFVDGKYMAGEVNIVGSIAFILEGGVAYIEVTTTVDKLRFRFGNIYRSKFFVKDGKQMPDSTKSILDAKSKFESYRTLLASVQLEYALDKNEKKQNKGE